MLHPVPEPVKGADKRDGASCPASAAFSEGDHGFHYLGLIYRRTDPWWRIATREWGC